MRRLTIALFAATVASTLVAAAAAAAAATTTAPVDSVPDIPSGAVATPRVIAHTANLPYGGGQVLHFNRTHLLFWIPAGSGLGFSTDYEQQMETFLARVAHDSHLPGNVYALTGQYRDGSGPAVYASTYAGAIVDTDPLPPRDPLCNEPAPPPADTGPGWSLCVSDQQIQDELTRVISAHRLPRLLTDLYFVVTPNGLGDCDTRADPFRPIPCALAGSKHAGYCGYHSYTSREVLYAVIPFNAVPGHCQSESPRPNGSDADPAVSSLSHEHNEMVTDPLGDAWIDGDANENGDLCLDMQHNPPPVLGGSGSTAYDQVIDGGRYWLQLEWSNQEGGCVARDEADPLAVSAPRSAKVRTRIRLHAHGADPDGRITSYLWAFGDGTRGHGASPRHTYRHTGRFALTVRSTDAAGNWALAGRTIKIRQRRARR